jgi:hypothetical protein
MIRAAWFSEVWKLMSFLLSLSVSVNMYAKCIMSHAALLEDLQINKGSLVLRSLGIYAISVVAVWVGMTQVGRQIDKGILILQIRENFYLY